MFFGKTPGRFAHIFRERQLGLPPPPPQSGCGHAARGKTSLTAETALGANVDAVNEAYFQKEVAPHVPDAWIDKGKTDEKDKEVGIVGYEIPFNRHFHEYEPPRPLQEIDAELDELSGEIMQMLQEVHS